MDLAVGFAPDLAAGFYQQALFDQDFVCLASRDHPRIRSKISRNAFVAEGHIVVASSATGHSARHILGQNEQSAIVFSNAARGSAFMR